MSFTRQSQPWAGRAVTCPGADPGPVACPDLPPAGSCSWGMAAAPLDGAGPSQHQGMEAHAGHSWDCTSLAVSCRAWAGREVWILPGLLRPCSHLHLHFLPVRLDGATRLLRCLHPLASWKRAKDREGGQHQWEHPARLLMGTQLGAFPAPTSPGCPVPPSAQ